MFFQIILAARGVLIGSECDVGLSQLVKLLLLVVAATSTLFRVKALTMRVVAIHRTTQLMNISMIGQRVPVIYRSFVKH